MTWWSKHVGEDRAFGEALLREAIDTMLTGDVDTGKAISIAEVSGSGLNQKA